MLYLVWFLLFVKVVLFRLGFFMIGDVFMFEFKIVVLVGSLCKGLYNLVLVYVLEKFVGDKVWFDYVLIGDLLFYN